MTPERIEALEQKYEAFRLDPNEFLPPREVALDVMELVATLKATMTGMAAQLQTFCPPEEAAVLRGAAERAREVVEAARRYISTPSEPGNWDEERAHRHHALHDALKRHDEADK